MRPARPDRRIALLLGALGVALLAAGPARVDPFARFELPDEWQARFWGAPEAIVLMKLEPKALAALVPAQAGLKFCPCPGCQAPEADEPLGWSIRKPKVVTCKRCNATFPDDKIPAKADGKVPEEAVEVAPGLIHKYPYHVPEPEHRRFPDERTYLDARRDHAAREYLAKAALYAAVRYRDRPADPDRPALARVAAVLILRFAQVYPNYAQHLDQPGQPKYFEPARRPPPYRRGYATGKWDWSGALDVPINLVIAYAAIRDDPALAEAGRILNEPEPARAIEDGLFRASAAFSAGQGREMTEASLQVDRGLLAVGRLLGDEPLIAEATGRLGEFAERGFTFDGLWRTGDVATHRRVLGMLDGWIDRLMTGPGPASAPPPMLALARSAGSALLAEPAPAEAQRASWPPAASPADARRPILLGGSGVARLAVGEGDDALDLELRGMGQVDNPRSRRQALRVAVGGRTVLGDRDDEPPRADGFDLASASHNTVLVDGLNQRETPRMMREASAGGDFLYYAADPDFQVAVLDDPRAYPRTTEAGGYRQTVVACSGPKAQYAVAAFEVRGGSSHDQIFHATSGRWLTSVPMAPGPDSLLPPAISYLTSARVEDGRWFVQALGEFGRMSQGAASRAAVVEVHDPGRPGLRLHLLGDTPAGIVAAATPRSPSPDDPARPALLVRRSAEKGKALATTFVTLFEPTGPGRVAAKVGRMTRTPGFVVLYLETADGPEHLVINLRPGTPRPVELADGRELTTDAWVVRARGSALVAAGGTVASTSDASVRQDFVTGPVLASARFPTAGGRGWFETDAVIPADPSPIGRTLIVRHGDGTTHGWTLARVEPAPGKRTRLHVREEPGFLIEGGDRHARYYQFPGNVSPGPHTFAVSTIRR